MDFLKSKLFDLFWFNHSAIPKHVGEYSKNTTNELSGIVGNELCIYAKR